MRIRDPGWKKLGSRIRDVKNSDPGCLSRIRIFYIPDPATLVRGLLVKNPYMGFCHQSATWQSFVGPMFRPRVDLADCLAGGPEDDAQHQNLDEVVFGSGLRHVPGTGERHRKQEDKFLKAERRSWCQCSGSVIFWYGSGSSDPYLCLTDPGGPKYGSYRSGTLRFLLLSLLDDGRIRSRSRTWLTDPDANPGGPKTYGPYGSGSPTLPDVYCEGTVPVPVEEIF